jgi:hypothetical protein
MVSSLVTRTSTGLPSSNTASPTAADSNQTGGAAATTTAAASGDSGLSTGAAIGVGISIPLVVIAIAVAGFLYWRKHRKVVQLQHELQNRDGPPPEDAKTMPPPAELKPPSVGSNTGSAGPLINEAGGNSVSEMAAVNVRQSTGPAELPANEMAPPPAYAHGDVKMDSLTYEQARPGHVHEAPGTIPPPPAHLSPESDVASQEGTLGRQPISPMGSETVADANDIVSPATTHRQG